MQREQIIPLQGGLDLINRAISIIPGYCIAAQNYEPNVLGYGRMEGYERYDGQPQPHLASYWLLGFDSGSTAIVAGNTVTGATSGATGKALYDATADSGTWGGGDAAGTVILYNVSGTFEDDEGLEVSASNVATADGEAVERGETDTDLDATYYQAAIEARRSSIAPGLAGGAIAGIATYNGDIYIFQQVGSTAGASMQKATSASWSTQTLGYTLAFETGNVEPAEGATITGGTSGATATLERITLSSGTWAGGDAAGSFTISSITGTFQNGETLNISGGSTAVEVGVVEAITLPYAASGKYRSFEYNFYASADKNRLYVVNSAGYALQWDGTTMAEIRTFLSAVLDKPRFVGVHSNHLLLGYGGGALLASGTGEPLNYTSTAGAVELNIGQTITGIQSSAKKSTVITARNKISYLTGSDASDFVLSSISDDSGAVEDTMAMIGEVHFMDDIGVRSMSASQNFGDWNVGTVTELIEPLIRARRAAGKTIIGAHRVRSKNQYRLYYSDGYVICIYFGRKKPECMPFMLDFTPTCVFSGEDSSGDEILLVGSDEGYVYRMDVGTSADGEEIQAYMRFSFTHQGDPNRNKRYHRALLSIANGGPATSLQYSSDYSYGNSDLPSGVDFSLSLPGSGGFWDEAIWDQFYWDAAVQSEGYAELNGIGKNISITVISDATYELPHTMTTLAINYSPRRKLR